MQTQAQIYRSVRHKQSALPALSAWQHAGQKLEVDRWIARVDFEWNDPIAPRFARWRESGFDIEACLETDEHGWDLVGVDTIGEFQNRWVPGAIAHDRFNNRVLDWFVPANASYAQAHPVYRPEPLQHAAAAAQHHAGADQAEAHALPQTPPVLGLLQVVVIEKRLNPWVR